MFFRLGIGIGNWAVGFGNWHWELGMIHSSVWYCCRFRLMFVFFRLMFVFFRLGIGIGNWVLGIGICEVIQKGHRELGNGKWELGFRN